MSAFNQFKRKTVYISGLCPPACHIVPYATGGLKALWKRVEGKEDHVLSEYGSYTSKEGIFRPCEGMPPLGRRYRYVDTLSRGVSCVLISAKDEFQEDKLVAVKVLHHGHSQLGEQEATILQRLNQADPHDAAGILRIRNVFEFDGHFCMVFDLLDPRPLSSLFKDISEDEVLVRLRQVALKLLQVVGFLYQENFIHADLKIENILIAKDGAADSLRVVDFGNALPCVHDKVSMYCDDFELQTLLYRAPEVMFGLPFGLEVDMWSIGCVLLELYLGCHPFTAGSKQGVLSKITDLLGPFPRHMYRRGKFYETLKEFTSDPMENRGRFTLMEKLGVKNYEFADFVSGFLQYNPADRLTPSEAASHVFLAPQLGFRFLLPPSNHGMSTYPKLSLMKEVYQYGPVAEKTSYGPLEQFQRLTKKAAVKQARITAEALAKEVTEGQATSSNNRTLTKRKICQVQPVMRSSGTSQGQAENPEMEDNSNAGAVRREPAERIYHSVTDAPATSTPRMDNSNSTSISNHIIADRNTQVQEPTFSHTTEGQRGELLSQSSRQWVQTTPKRQKTHNSRPRVSNKPVCPSSSQNYVSPRAVHRSLGRNVPVTILHKDESSDSSLTLSEGSTPGMSETRIRQSLEDTVLMGVASLNNESGNGTFLVPDREQHRKITKKNESSGNRGIRKTHQHFNKPNVKQQSRLDLSHGPTVPRYSDESLDTELQEHDEEPLSQDAAKITESQNRSPKVFTETGPDNSVFSHSSDDGEHLRDTVCQRNVPQNDISCRDEKNGVKEINRVKPPFKSEMVFKREMVPASEDPFTGYNEKKSPLRNKHSDKSKQQITRPGQTHLDDRIHKEPRHSCKEIGVRSEVRKKDQFENSLYTKSCSSPNRTSISTSYPNPEGADATRLPILQTATSQESSSSWHHFRTPERSAPDDSVLLLSAGDSRYMHNQVDNFQSRKQSSDTSFTEMTESKSPVWKKKTCSSKQQSNRPGQDLGKNTASEVTKNSDDEIMTKLLKREDHKDDLYSAEVFLSKTKTDSPPPESIPKKPLGDNTSKRMSLLTQGKCPPLTLCKTPDRLPPDDSVLLLSEVKDERQTHRYTEHPPCQRNIIQKDVCLRNRTVGHKEDSTLQPALKCEGHFKDAGAHVKVEPERICVDQVPKGRSPRRKECFVSNVQAKQQPMTPYQDSYNKSKCSERGTGVRSGIKGYDLKDDLYVHAEAGSSKSNSELSSSQPDLGKHSTRRPTTASQTLTSRSPRVHSRKHERSLSDDSLSPNSNKYMQSTLIEYCDDTVTTEFPKTDDIDRKLLTKQQQYQTGKCSYSERNNPKFIKDKAYSVHHERKCNMIHETGEENRNEKSSCFSKSYEGKTENVLPRTEMFHTEKHESFKCEEDNSRLYMKSAGKVKQIHTNGMKIMSPSSNRMCISEESETVTHSDDEQQNTDKLDSSTTEDCQLKMSSGVIKIDNCNQVVKVNKLEPADVGHNQRLKAMDSQGTQAVDKLEYGCLITAAKTVGCGLNTKMELATKDELDKGQVTSTPASSKQKMNSGSSGKKINHKETVKLDKNNCSQHDMFMYDSDESGYHVATLNRKSPDKNADLGKQNSKQCHRVLQKRKMKEKEKRLVHRASAPPVLSENVSATATSRKSVVISEKEKPKAFTETLQPHEMSKQGQDKEVKEASVVQSHRGLSDCIRETKFSCVSDSENENFPSSNRASPVNCVHGTKSGLNKASIGVSEKNLSSVRHKPVTEKKAQSKSSSSSSNSVCQLVCNEENGSGFYRRKDIFTKETQRGKKVLIVRKRPQGKKKVLPNTSLEKTRSKIDHPLNSLESKGVKIRPVKESSQNAHKGDLLPVLSEPSCSSKTQLNFHPAESVSSQFTCGSRKPKRASLSTCSLTPSDTLHQRKKYRTGSAKKRKAADHAQVAMNNLRMYENLKTQEYLCKYGGMSKLSQERSLHVPCSVKSSADIQEQRSGSKRQRVLPPDSNSTDGDIWAQAVKMKGRVIKSSKVNRNLGLLYNRLSDRGDVDQNRESSEDYQVKRKFSDQMHHLRGRDETTGSSHSEPDDEVLQLDF